MRARLGGTGLKNLCAEGIGHFERTPNPKCGRDTRLAVNFMFPMLRTQLEASCATREELGPLANRSGTRSRTAT